MEFTHMFSRSPFVIHVRRYGEQLTGRSTGGFGWALILPGLFLTCLALAILLWPELLAYMVASLLLFVGLGLISWGWWLRQSERRW
jgi:hypothetical protein